MSATRKLIVTADDFGIGPATSRGILDLARQGRVTSTVLLVNSPHAETAVRAWRHANVEADLGWHPNLTLDAPVSPLRLVPSLVGPDGNFWHVGAFLRRWALRQLRGEEIEIELRAQYKRFLDLAGTPPAAINAHQHVQLFPPVGAILVRILRRQQPLPYLRRVHESTRTLLKVSGTFLKRTFLASLGRRHARLEGIADFPGNDFLAAIANPGSAAAPDFFTRWLAQATGQVVELVCHPGYLDPTLLGRDCTTENGWLLQRVRELRLLSHVSFDEACAQAGFRLVAPSRLRAADARPLRLAA